MSNEKMRAEFEAWWTGGSFGDRPMDTFDGTKNAAWVAWQAARAQPAGEAVAWRLFKQALFVGMERDCLHYLMANTKFRRDGALKAHNHDLLCRHIVAAVRGCNPDMVRRYHEDDYEAVHDGTQALTSYLDEVIGFPLDERPDYDDMVPKFFDKFFELAMAALDITAPPAQVPDERSAFELEYAKQWQSASPNAANHTLDYLCSELKEMRNGDQYGEGQDYLNFKWEGWKDRSMLAAAPQPKGGE